ncbi:MAG: NAD(P)H-hydrate dehydratase [Clostridia bacterium]|nr:NAD(P)H-hydrate dehydratase [Clostridia bacterium]
MKILSLSQIRAAEISAVESGAFSFAGLMKNAGEEAVEIMKNRYSFEGKRVAVFCGKGNNGGDGLVIASRLSRLGANVSLCFPFGIPATDTAACFFEDIKGLNIISEIGDDYDFVIDALFGIGLDRALEGYAAEIIDKMNMCSGVKIAIDIPSGVPCDADFTPKKAFMADFTVTFIATKPCFVLPATSHFCGEFAVADIGAETKDYSYLTIERPIAVKRNKNTHKGSYGTALMLCGSYGMCGASILAARSALRSGVGLLKAFVCDKNYTAFTTSVPEAVTLPVPTDINGVHIIGNEILEAELKNADSLLLGCGLGQSDTAVKLIKKVLLTVENTPLVIDADGINAVSRDINIIKKIKAPVIFTPHPKEMARLCHTTVNEIEKNRVEYAKNFARNYSCIVVLKGANTIVAAPDGRIFFNLTGNAGLATGGSGDVLSGMIASYLAQGVSPLSSALNAVYFHGLAGDMAAEKSSKRALLPSDIIEELKYIPY